MDATMSYLYNRMTMTYLYNPATMMIIVISMSVQQIKEFLGRYAPI